MDGGKWGWVGRQDRKWGTDTQAEKEAHAHCIIDVMMRPVMLALPKESNVTSQGQEKSSLEASHRAKEMRSAVRRFWPSPEDSGWPGSF